MSTTTYNTATEIITELETNGDFFTYGELLSILDVGSKNSYLQEVWGEEVDEFLSTEPAPAEIAAKYVEIFSDDPAAFLENYFDNDEDLTETELIEMFINR